MFQGFCKSARLTHDIQKMEGKRDSVKEIGLKEELITPNGKILKLENIYEEEEEEVNKKECVPSRKGTKSHAVSSTDGKTVNKEKRSLGGDKTVKDGLCDRRSSLRRNPVAVKNECLFDGEDKNQSSDGRGDSKKSSDRRKTGDQENSSDSRIDSREEKSSRGEDSESEKLLDKLKRMKNSGAFGADSGEKKRPVQKRRINRNEQAQSNDKRDLETRGAEPQQKRSQADSEEKDKVSEFHMDGDIEQDDRLDEARGSPDSSSSCDPSSKNGSYNWDSDNLLLCDDCCKDYEGDCPTHGPLYIIEDTPIPVDVADRFRACKTAPPQISLVNPEIGDGETGVWAREPIPARTRFGPYEGKILPLNMPSCFTWLVRKNGEPHHFVDASEPGVSNWMRFVNFSRKKEERNLQVFQYQGKIYYRTLRSLAAGEELLVWCGAEEQGIDSPVGGSQDQEMQRETPSGHPDNREVDANTTAEILKEILGSEIEFACPECNKRFHRKALLKKHMWIHSSTKPFSCPVCQKRFTESGHLARHLRTHSGERPFVCAQCNMGFSQKEILKRHLLTHTSDKPFECGECGKKFTTRHSKEMHLRTHREEKDFVCPICDKGFSRQEILNRHLSTHREKSKRRFECPICSRRFTESGHVTRHLQTHSGERPFVCTECNMGFSRKETLKRHLLTHTDEKPFVCNQCDKRFTTRHSLEVHTKVHSGAKDYVCPLCNKAFARQEILKKHMWTHTGEKQYMCPVCSHRFTESGHLYRHLRTHTGLRPFMCNVCEASFARKETLKRHLWVHSEKKPFSCSECDKHFTARHNLEKHLSSHSEGKTSKSGRRFSRREVVKKQQPNERFTCPVCSERFSNGVHLDRHLLAHSKESVVGVDCDTAFIAGNTLEIHLDMLTAENPFEDAECEERFMGAIHGHLETDDGAAPFEGTHCEVELQDVIGCEDLNEYLETDGEASKPFDGAVNGVGFVEDDTFNDHLGSQRERKPADVAEGNGRFAEGENVGGFNREKHLEHIESDSRFVESETLSNHLIMPFGGADSASEFWGSGTDDKLENADGRKRPYICSQCDMAFTRKEILESHLLVHDKEKRFSCPICTRRFSESGHLRRHLRTHSGERPFVCTVCNTAFSQKDTLKRHLLVHTDDKPFACTQCDKSFTTRHSLEMHFRAHSGERNYVCPVCEKTFSRREVLKRHLLTHGGEKHFVCPVCSRRFGENGHLIRHLRTHSGERPFTCSECPMAFSQKGTLKRHLLTHSEVKPFSCVECQKAFTTRHSLLKHVETHERGTFVCTECNKTYSRREILRRHLRTHGIHKGVHCVSENTENEAEEKRVLRSSAENKPQVAGSDNPKERNEILDGFPVMKGERKAFEGMELNTGLIGSRSSGSLVVKSEEGVFQAECRVTRSRSLECHLEIKREEDTFEESGFDHDDHEKDVDQERHSEDPPFEGIESDFGLPNVVGNDLDRNLEVLIGEGPYEGSGYVESQDLDRHFETANLGKAYVCGVCDSEFADLRTLRQHRLTHDVLDETCIQQEIPKGHLRNRTGKRRFECLECKKRFYERRTLERHLLTHTGDRPFVCDVCNAAFARKETLSRHVLTHSEEKPFVCSECGSDFAGISSLRRHLQQAHTERIFACPECNKTFSRKEVLKKHFLVHTGEKHFACAMCSIRFAERGHLVRHLRTHSGEKPFECSECGKRFSRKDCLKRHETIHN